MVCVISDKAKIQQTLRIHKKRRIFAAKKRMKSLITFGLLAVVTVACQNASQTTTENTTTTMPTPQPVVVNYPDSLIDNTFEPCKRLGKLHNEVSVNELIKLYGNENVTTYRDTINGKAFATTVLFEGQLNELQILWHNEELLQYPSMCSYNNEKAVWQAPEGIKIGMTLAELEKINGKPLDFMGFHTGQGGLITNWQEGKLKSIDKCFNIVLGFDRTKVNLIDADLKGNSTWKSNNAKVSQLDIKVASIRVFLNKK